MSDDFPSRIQVQLEKSGWLKRSYLFMDDNTALATLVYEKSYSKTAKAIINNDEFSICRRGFWKHYLEIVSSSQKHHNMRVNINWRGTIKINDSAGNPFVFKSTGFWKTRWQWLDRHERPLIEIKSKSFSKTNRGLIEIKYPEITDILFWIIVSWFVILCSESDAAAAAVT